MVNIMQDNDEVASNMGAGKASIEEIANNKKIDLSKFSLYKLACSLISKLFIINIINNQYKNKKRS